MATREYITVREFATLVGLRERAARLALHAAESDRLWRGARLEVRRVPSRGGASGLAYEVARDTIPSAFLVASKALDSDAAPHCDSRPDQLLSAHQEPLITASEASQKPSFPSPTDQSPQVAKNATILPPSPNLPPPIPRARITANTAEGEWRYNLVRPIIATTAPNSRERAALIEQIASTPLIDWKRRSRTIAQRTIRKWIVRYEATGVGGLMRKAPSNGGQRRFVLSRAWDQAMDSAGVSKADQSEIAKQVRHRVRSEWRSGTPSWPTVQLNTLPTVVDLSRAAGLDRPDAELHALCMVPRRFVEAERHYAIIAMKESDAARFASNVVPRIKRDRSALLPMEWVAGDVHPLDILFQRPDGTTCCPRLIVWEDLATNRVRWDMFVAPPGEAVRTEHVIQSFVSLCSDWGVMRHLYIDNGGEYNWLDMAEPLSRLAHAPEIHGIEQPGAAGKAVQRARPYNAQAKVIEGVFATLERSVFPQLPGYIGGNRMRKKTANQGRAPKPFDGDEAALRQAVSTAVAYYHRKPQTGHLDGQSPESCFAAFVEAGWKRTILDPDELEVAFSREMRKPVHTGGTLRLGGVEYRANGLQSYVGLRVLVRQPLFGDQNKLFVFTEQGQPIDTAFPDTRYAFADDRGAEEQGRRQAALNATIRELAKDTVRLDGEQSMAAVVALHGPAAEAPTDGVIRIITPEFSEAAHMAKNAPARAEEETARTASVRARKSALLKLMDADARQRMAG
jgi:hypothetical protein